MAERDRGLPRRPRRWRPEDAPYHGAVGAHRHHRFAAEAHAGVVVRLRPVTEVRTGAMAQRDIRHGAAASRAIAAAFIALAACRGGGQNKPAPETAAAAARLVDAVHRSLTTTWAVQ